MPSSIQARPRTLTGEIRISEILGGLSRALDITEGHPQGHAARSCLIGMRIAAVLNLDGTELADLFYATLLKDAGCSSNAARLHQLFGGEEHSVKRSVWLTDWRRASEKAGHALAYLGRGEGLWSRMGRLVALATAGPVEQQLFQLRCDRGAAIASDLGFSDATANAIRCMDEHWDGGGQPAGLRAGQIPMAAQIIGLAQVLEIFWQEHGLAAAFDMAARRSGRWFDPALVRAAQLLAADPAFWSELRLIDPMVLLARDEPGPVSITADAGRLDRIATGFAAVIDAKSPYTYDHSRRVSEYACAIARCVGFSAEGLVRVRRTALLHDIGKLGVPNSVLDKPGALTAEEWSVVRKHPKYTYDILSAVPIFDEFAFDASCHHEKLDGTGYHSGWGGAELTPTGRLLAVADITDALLADRPYRPGMTPDRAMAILRADGDHGKLCRISVAAVSHLLDTGALRDLRAAAA